MKFRIGSYLMMLAGVTMLFSACGGDGGGGSVPTTVTVTALKNPVLVNFSTTVVASFANYTSAVKFGSPVHFTLSPSLPTAIFSNHSSVTTVKTQANGVAAVKVKSIQPGTFTVSASSGNLAGSTTVSFINPPAKVTVQVGLKQPLTGVGDFSFDVVNLSDPTPTLSFTNFSTSVHSPVITDLHTIPSPPATGVPTTTLTLSAVAPGINMGAGTPLFRFDYLPQVAGVPNFTLANSFVNLAPLPLSSMFIRATYYDANGNVLLVFP